MTAHCKNFTLQKLRIKYGFTLIELMVVMAIISIIASITYAGYSRFNQQQQINIAYEDLKNDLAEAKSKAMSQVITECEKTAGVNKIFRGYQISFSPSGKSYSLEEVCEWGGGTYKTDVVIKTKPEKNTITFSTPQHAPRFVRFNPLTGGVDGGITITIKNDSMSQSRIITVTPSGNIE